MGLISGLLGNASEADVGKVQQEFEPFLIEGENVVAAFKLLRDMFVFTEKRLILVDRQGLTGKKSEYVTIPYSSITHFSKESAGTFDLDAELKIFIRGAMPISKQFNKKVDINRVYKLLSQAVLG